MIKELVTFAGFKNLLRNLGDALDYASDVSLMKKISQIVFQHTTSKGVGACVFLSPSSTFPVSDLRKPFEPEGGDLHKDMNMELENDGGVGVDKADTNPLQVFLPIYFMNNNCPLLSRITLSV